jgi:hypothetical protein
MKTIFEKNGSEREPDLKRLSKKSLGHGRIGRRQNLVV